MLIYVHGSGNQDYKSGEDLKKDYDDKLFGKPGPSVAPTWWQVFWCAKKPPAEVALDALIERIADQPASVEVAADELLDAIRAARPPQPPIDIPAESTEAERSEQARSMIRDLYVAAEAAGAAEPAEMPDRIFKILAGQAAKDVVPYLYDGWACRMREPVKAKLREFEAERPLIVLAHSLGSVLAYDVVTDPEFSNRDLRLFLTAGSPLGILNVVAKVRDWQGPGPFPKKAPSWRNFYDPRDWVGKFGESLFGKYELRPPLKEKLDVDNACKGHHDLVGYLVDRDLKEAVHRAVEFQS